MNPIEAGARAMFESDKSTDAEAASPPPKWLIDLTNNFQIHLANGVATTDELVKDLEFVVAMLRKSINQRMVMLHGSGGERTLADRQEGDE